MWLSAIGVALTLLAVADVGVRAESGPAELPRLRFEAPDLLAPQVRRLERLDPARLLAVVRLVGLEAPGLPIRVVLAPEDASLAKETPAAITAFATGDLIVVFPARTPSYPHETLEEVLQHEVAHVLIARAAGHQPVPRWFHEGVARLAERTWSLGERTRFVYSLAAGGAVTPSRLDAWFQGDPGAVARAYSVSGAFVQHLVDTHGPDLPARVLRAMRDGRGFDAAFLEATGTSVTDANAGFWRAQRFWLTWFPWLTSPEAVFALITALAFAAIWRVRARRAARRAADAAADLDDGETAGEEGDTETGR